ncbi:uncharacterized protein LOC131207032 [Anopheles bellator]|uniref:uncharacterized protein LOC131207032 n=1 Tax=Anopheles bellator TaxID=139047 RepID=UPI0026493813|nr:uncharacterized protein LOC131207032 [Anopheles bellator]
MSKVMNMSEQQQWRRLQFTTTKASAGRGSRFADERFLPHGRSEIKKAQSEARFDREPRRGLRLLTSSHGSAIYANPQEPPRDKRHRRRESAPPTVGQNQDVAYLEALAKFNEWRAQQRNSDIDPGVPLNVANGGSGCPPVPRPSLAHRTIKEEGSGDDSDCECDFSSDIELAADERMPLSRTISNCTRLEVPKSPRYARHHRTSTVAPVALATPPFDAVAPKKPQRSVEFYRNITRIPVDTQQEHWNNTPVEKNHSSVDVRFSLPISGAADRSKPRKRSKGATCFPKPNNTIHENEVAEFEAHHLNGTGIGTDSFGQPSPPRRFYKDNSSPYSNVTPKKQSNLKPRAGGRLFKDKPAPQPPSVGRAQSMKQSTTVDRPTPSSCPAKHPAAARPYSGSDSPLTGSYRNYELNSSSLYDENVISSRAYRGSMKEPVPTPPKHHRKSLSYQTVVNKHGDLVDYALPFSDNADTTGETAPPEMASRPGQETLAEIRQCEQLINDNFHFLQTSAELQDDSTSIILEPISVLKGRSARIVTDLDRSAGASTLKEADPAEEQDAPDRSPILAPELGSLREEPEADILFELDSLQKWSKSIQQSDELLQTRYTDRNLLECFRRSAGGNLVTCFPNEVRYRVGSLRAATAGPLEFSCGLFRGVAVTLRKYSLNVERSLYFAEEACKRDFEVLSQVRHPTVATLMAVSYDAALNQATLLLEPFDFTLFDYIHRMNKRLSLIHAITVVQQIASAVCYLQECGYVHSNISSGAVLMRRYPYTVKLTSFELTTESATEEVRREIEQRYGSTSSSRNSMTSSQNEELKKFTTYSRYVKIDEQFLRDKYRKLSREICETRTRRGRSGGLPGLGDTGDASRAASRFLPYCKEYREKFSLFYYVAPELLVPKSSFVYPNRSTDVYAIALLLWEILNGYVPFVVYSRAELEKLHTSADLPLPMFERERCERFRQIFEGSLGDMGARKMSVGDVVDLLDCVLLELGTEKNGAYDSVLAEDYEERANSSEVRLKNELNDVRKLSAHVVKTAKTYFPVDDGGELHDAAKPKQSPQSVEPLPKKPARKINRLREVTGTEGPEPMEPRQTPRPVEKKSPAFNLSNSGIYQSIFDFNHKFLSPKSAKQAVYDRTSTVKKHKKPPRTNKNSAKELFEGTDPLNKSFTEATDGPTDDGGLLEIRQLDQSVRKEPSVLKDTPPASDSDDVGRTPVAHGAGHPSKSCDSSPGARRRSVTPRMLNNSFRFTIGDFTLPDTPIARKNRIRKHAWLSDQKLKMTDESLPVTPEEECRSKSFFNAGLAGRSSSSFLTSTNLNSSTSLQDIKPKRINISVNIYKSPEQQNGTPSGGLFESTLWRKEKIICERSQLPVPATDDQPEKGPQSEDRPEEPRTEELALDDSMGIVTAHLTSVRDAIKKIETTFEKHGFDYSPVRKVDSVGRTERGGRTSAALDESLVVEENLLVPTKVLELEKTLEAEQAAAEAQDGSPAPPPIPVSSPPSLRSGRDESLEGSAQPENATEPAPAPVEPRETHRAMGGKVGPTSIPITFAPNSQLYMRRKALNTATNSVATIHHHQQTLYRESIISSTEHSLPAPLVAEPFPIGAAATGGSSGSARKKKLTTRVTVNMRKISRRASDISPGSSRPNSANLDDLDLPSSGCITPTGSLKSCAANLRHSCGNELLRAFSKLRLMPPEAGETGVSKLHGATTTADSSRSVTPVGGVIGQQQQPPAGAAGRPTERFVCCQCGNSMMPVEGFNVPTGSRIGMAAAFGELNFPRESFASMFEPPLTPTSATALASRIHAMTPFQKSTEDLYIDDDFCQGLNQMGANMELVEPLDEEQYLDTFGYDIYSTEIYHAEEEEEEEEENGGELDPRDHCAAATPLTSVEHAHDEAMFLEKCTQLNSESLKAEFATVLSPTDCAPPSLP